MKRWKVCLKVFRAYQDMIDGKRPTFALWAIVVLGILVLAIVPYILTRHWLSVVDYTETGQIGDTIGGTVGPIIALMAATLTFIAFYVQYQANKSHTAQFDKQAVDTMIERFENKYYEMIRIHQANVEGIDIDGSVGKRKAFVPLVDELRGAYLVLKYTQEQDSEDLGWGDYGDDDCINIAYIAFLMGVGDKSGHMARELLVSYEENMIHNYLKNLELVQSASLRDKDYEVTLTGGVRIRLGYVPFKGHISILGHYYRHLYQTVKYVAEYREAVLPSKYDYIKTIRAQLSSHEQLLLYYNSLSVFGNPWLQNEYFTKYLMIKNIPLPLANFGPSPRNKLGIRNKEGKLLFEWDEIRDV